MDAIVMLREDHKAVEKLFKKLEKGDLGVVPEVCEMLMHHAKVEEEIFYPAVRENVSGEEDTVLESVEEHHVVKTLINEIGGAVPGRRAVQGQGHGPHGDGPPSRQGGGGRDVPLCP